MSTRVGRYYEDEIDEKPKTRFRRNEELYREISKNELNSYDIKSNATILGEHKNEIDVEQIKKILDTKYKEAPRKSINLDNIEEKESDKEDTKEYDLNVILEKAKEEHQENYQEERLKKLRNTSLDILKNLDLEKYNEDEQKEDDSLDKLIKTIAHNAKEDENSNSLDILSDLKGSGKTEVMEGLKEEVENKELNDSFYTKSNKLSEKDFEEIDDFSDIEDNNTFIKILIPIIIIIFIVGLFFILKNIIF